MDLERENETLLIHGTDWNRLDITRLSDDLLLTNRIIDPDHHYSDYFHSSIVVSDDSKYFTVNGWRWSPVDSVIVYSVDDFLKQYEKCFKSIEMFDVFSGYNWDRPLCFMGNHSIVIGHNPNEGEDGAEKVPSEIFIYDIHKGEKGGFVKDIPIEHRVQFDGFHMDDEYGAQGNLFYDEETDYFIGLNKVTGLIITDRNGNVLKEDNHFNCYAYSSKDRLFYRDTFENGFKLEIIKLDELIDSK
ncbi:hypothetical protein J2Z48_002212 [Croceifilum oryzae]|uniref:Uncharacterized protein n=1 Tax=Croceifilum oryzae TaxID=1553429 RepID=A0AAJ1TFQ4_9BACL|nr:hypothetical protein [Croceifilum oryzae]MDQ0418023.1 hypothetical protein [Croceifilum oryzae]